VCVLLWKHRAPPPKHVRRMNRKQKKSKVVVVVDRGEDEREEMDALAVQS